MTLPDWNNDDLSAASPYLNVAIAEYGLDASLIYGQCSRESRFKANAYRAEPQINDASYGLMQVLYKTAQALGYQGDPSGLFDPATSADLGCKFMAQLLTKYNGDWTQALSAYNSGKPTGSTAGAAYAAQVMTRANWFADLFASQQPPSDTGDGSGDDTTTPGGDSSGVVVGVIAALGGLYALWRWLK